MSTQPSAEVTVPVLQCMYPDCGNSWVPRTARMPKVCPRCKRYGWQTGTKMRRKKPKDEKGGKENVAQKSSMKGNAQLGPKTKEFLDHSWANSSKNIKPLNLNL